MPRSALGVLLTWMILGGMAEAASTNIVVRATAKDALFIGTSMGGAWVTIRDSQSGALLAQGATHGGTGNREIIMGEARKRATPLSDASTAKFEARLDLAEPVLATIEVFAPFGQRQAQVRSSTQVWLIPGKDIEGDGIIVEIPGFAIDLLHPQPAEKIALAEGTATVPMTANVVMMCGCPVTTDGPWDANQYEVHALIKRNGEPVGAAPLAYAKKASTFAASLEVAEPGVYELQVYAYDKRTGNTGLDTTTFQVTKEEATPR